MQLIYTDESGINYYNRDGKFKDGPYIFYGGICVDDKKYFHLERMFLELINDSFSIENWKSNEIHATDIWQRKGYFSNFTEEQIKHFFSELLQLLIKLDIQTIVGCQKKIINADSETKKKQEANAIYAFLHSIEFSLSKKSETGIIIADKKSRFDSETSLFSKIFQERTNWRANPGIKFKPTIKSKFSYESKLCFLLDNIHYVDSKESIFNQIVDIVLFIIMRVFTYQNMKINSPNLAELKKVPIENETFSFFALCSLNIAQYNNIKNDVFFETGLNLALQSTTLKKNEFIPDIYFKKSFC